MKILILFLFALVYSVSSCNTSKKSMAKQKDFSDSNKISTTTNLDTVKTDVYDTLPGNYLPGFIKDSIMIKFLKSRFVNDICEPGNYTHPVYRHFEKEGSSLATIALNSLIDQGYSEENKLIGLVNYRKAASIVRSFGDYDSLSYHKILTLRKTPIALKNSFKIPEVNLSERFMDCFGYTENNHLFFSRCTQGNYYLIQQGKNKGEIVQQDCITQTAESYFIKGSPSLLNQIITRAYNLLLNQKK